VGRKSPSVVDCSCTLNLRADTCFQGCLHKLGFSSIQVRLDANFSAMNKVCKCSRQGYRVRYVYGSIITIALASRLHSSVTMSLRRLEAGQHNSCGIARTTRPSQNFQTQVPSLGPGDILDATRATCQEHTNMNHT